MIFVLLFLATCFLAYSNGANDDIKGVASLSAAAPRSYAHTPVSNGQIADLRRLVCSIFLAQMLLKKFSGNGIAPGRFAGSVYFMFAVAWGGVDRHLPHRFPDFSDARPDPAVTSPRACRRSRFPILGNGCALTLLLSAGSRVRDRGGDLLFSSHLLRRDRAL